MNELKLSALSRDIDQLIDLCEKLKKENMTLMTQKKALVAERSQLLDKNQVAKTRIESVEEIRDRLKVALEHIDANRLIAAPDCGLGLLGWDLAHLKLINLCKAAHSIG